MARKHTRLALIYDFDGTLAPGNMQERDFFPAIGVSSDEFWEEVNKRRTDQQADNILVYMQLMLERARSENIQFTREALVRYGKNLEFFAGVLPYREIEEGREERAIDGWFDRISRYARDSGIKIEHFVVSSGLSELIEGTPIAGKFKKIYASKFLYDANSVASWPGMAVNYTTKTQFLFRINKEKLDVDDDAVNEYKPKSERPVPFDRMIFIGDGETDVPCFRLVKEQGGYSIAVYPSNEPKLKKRAGALKNEAGRVSFATPADYRERSLLDRVVKSIIDKVQLEEELKRLG